MASVEDRIKAVTARVLSVDPNEIKYIIVTHAHEIDYDFPAETNFLAAPRERLRQFADI